MAADPDWYAGNYEFQVPIFVLTHTVPSKRPKQTDTLTCTFVTDGIERAIAQAKAAAGAKDITVMGYPVYQRLGFRDYCTISIYEWHSDAMGSR